MMLSVIIPALNEAGFIRGLIDYLFSNAGGTQLEVLVIDGGSRDETVGLAGETAAKVFTSPKTGRAAQMNFGASVATGEVLYFVHADTLPPASFAADIHKYTNEGFSLGRYRTKFDSNHWLLKLNAFFTRYDWFICYGGDQTLFITSQLFEDLGGYNEELKLMEEYEFVARARDKGRYKIMQKAALVSARKYDHNSWWEVQLANYRVVQMYKNGASQEELVQRYSEFTRLP